MRGRGLALMRRTVLLPLVLLVLGAGLVLGCASSGPQGPSAEAQAAAVGTWQYEVNGYAPLDEGTFRIRQTDGRLRGELTDRRRGRFRVRVDVRASRLELRMNDLRISGSIEDGTFTGVLRRSQWSVTSRQQRQQRRSRSRFRSASLSARRIRSATSADAPSVLDCQSILREASGCN